MSFHLHRAERAGPLVDALADVLAVPPADVFASDLVAVPTPGVERWLAQRLAGRLGARPGHGDGVCAGIEFPPLSSVLAAAVEVGSDWRQRPSDPWWPDRAAWPLLDLIDQSRGEPFAALLWRYLTRGSTDPGTAAIGGRRWATARRLSSLFSRYAAERPAMIRAWLAGRDVDAQGGALLPDRAWQPELWRRLRERLGVPSPVERVDEAVERLAADPGSVALPERLSVFGVTRLDTTATRLLAALAAGRDLHLWATHPSPALWDSVAQHLSRHRPRGGSRRADSSAALVRHPLLAHLGRDARELQTTLALAGGHTGDLAGGHTGDLAGGHTGDLAGGHDGGLAGRHDGGLPGGHDGGLPGGHDGGLAGGHDEDHHHPDRAVIAPTKLLPRLQADLRDNRAPAPPSQRLVWQSDDRSLSVHVSHGPDRQVEVLRDLLVGLLADDPTLEPRDIVVMCPDVETFAPHIVAAFGLESAEEGVDHPAHRLRVRLADRSLGEVNPVLEVVSRLLTLVASRMERTAVLDLAASPAVAGRFGFRDDDLSRLRELVTASGVRWGLDTADRRRYAMGGFGQNTWAAGLDRLLLGVALDESEHHHLGTALPLDDVDSGDVEVVGRFAELWSRLRAFSRAARQPRPLNEWVDLLRSALADLTAVPRRDGWQTAQAHALLSALADQADQASAALGVDEVTALWAHSVRARPGRANFRSGTITVCTMLPMRSVPHRVICLLGVDDGVFPRRLRVDGDDLVAIEEWIGDHSAPGEDRQLLLDAVMAAQDRLVIVYGGRDPRTGAVRPPAVPIGELIDALDQTAQSIHGGPVSGLLTTVHPLQPFDPANFLTATDPATDPVATGDGLPFSFDRAALRGAVAALRPRHEARSVFGRQPLADPAWDGTLEMTELTRFFAHPPRALLRERARLYRADQAEAPDELPVELDGLDRWSIGQRLLDAHLAGADLEVLTAAEWRRGHLPPRALGQAVLDDVTRRVARLQATAAPYRQGPGGRRDVVVKRPDWSLAGTIPGIHGTDLLRVQYGKLTARHRLDAWVHLVALSLAEPGQPWRAVLVGHQSGAVLGPLDQRWSELVLADLISLWRSGLVEPLPFAPKTSLRYAETRQSGQPWDPVRQRKLQEEWQRERDEIYSYFFGPEVADLLSEPVRPGEHRGGQPEHSRFGALAQRVFVPLLQRESPL